MTHSENLKFRIMTNGKDNYKAKDLIEKNDIGNALGYSEDNTEIALSSLLLNTKNTSIFDYHYDNSDYDLFKSNYIHTCSRHALFYIKLNRKKVAQRILRENLPHLKEFTNSITKLNPIPSFFYKNIGDYYFYYYYLTGETEYFKLSEKNYMSKIQKRNTADGFYDLGMLYFTNEDYVSTGKVLRKALMRYRDSFEIWILLALVYYKTEDLERSKHCFFVASKIFDIDQQAAFINNLFILFKDPKFLKDLGNIHLRNASSLERFFVNSFLGQGRKGDDAYSYFEDTSCMYNFSESQLDDYVLYLLNKSRRGEALCVSLYSGKSKNIVLSLEALGLVDLILATDFQDDNGEITKIKHRILDIKEMNFDKVSNDELKEIKEVLSQKEKLKRLNSKCKSSIAKITIKFLLSENNNEIAQIDRINEHREPPPKDQLIENSTLLAYRILYLLLHKNSRTTEYIRCLILRPKIYHKLKKLRIDPAQQNRLQN